MFKTKAETLDFLKKKIKLSKIPKTYFFSVLEWRENKKLIISKIKSEFSGKIVIRSSASDEDNYESSNAGKYKSFLNVNSKNNGDIEKKIKNIIKGYRKNSYKKSKILIQNKISSINSSGVVFNRDLSTGAKYYVINYDDVSGKSDTVTSGTTQNSNRVLFVYNKKLSDVKSRRFFKLLSSIEEIENIYKKIPLDIEFIITKNLDIYILQVRPLLLAKKNSFDQDDKINRSLNSLKKKISIKMINWNTIYGQMPDWNPAEIIGKYPYPLLSSLYKKLVLDNAWIKARKIMGYNDNFKKKALMEVFLNQSFIDVRKSFLSFLPHGLSKKLEKKIVDFNIFKLKKNPTLHDKIEFDISINCFLFDFEKRVKKLYPKLLIKSEIRTLKNKFKDIFIKNLNNFDDGSINTNLKKIYHLDRKLEDTKLEKDLEKVILFTKNFGVIPFSILARHAFIAENLLRSLIRLKIITNQDVDNFKSSFETVTSKFIKDCELLSKNKIDFNTFKKKYGHLRPGTYDINSKNYSSFKRDFFLRKRNLSIKKNIIFKLTISKRKNIADVLEKNNIKMTVDNFFDYLKDAIASREYSKFIFTKNVDLILKKISDAAIKNSLSKKQISFCEINDIIKLNNRNLLKKKLKNIIQENKEKYNTHLNIRLPMLLVDPEGVDVIPFQVSSPNFIGKNKVFYKMKRITSSSSIKRVSLNNKIILIENADPGFDWLFNFNIKGLITKFGGANSHMAIRCNELKIPAAIGIGEKIYEEIKDKEQIILNCPLKRIETN